MCGFLTIAPAAAPSAVGLGAHHLRTPSNTTHGHLFAYETSQGFADGIATYPIVHGRFSHKSDGGVGSPTDGTTLTGQFAFGPDGTLYAASCYQGTCAPVTLEIYAAPYATPMATIDLPLYSSGDSAPQGIVADDQGHVFVQVDGASNGTASSSVYVYQPAVSGSQILQNITIGQPGAGGLAIGPSGDLYVSDGFDKRIDVFTAPATHPRLVRTLTVQSLTALSIDPSTKNELYVGALSGFGVPIVEVFRADAHGSQQPIRTLSSPDMCGTNGPRDVEADGGKLFVVAPTQCGSGSGYPAVEEFDATAHGARLPGDIMFFYSCCRAFGDARLGP